MVRSRLSTLFPLFALLAAPLPFPRPAHGGVLKAAPAESAVRASADVDASAVEDGTNLERQVATRVKELLLEAEVLPARGDADARVGIVIAPGPDPENPSFVVKIVATRGGSPIEGASADVSCELCTNTEVADEIAAAVSGILPRLRAQEAPAPAPEPGPGPGPETMEPSPYGPEPDPGPTPPEPVDPAVRGLRGLGYGGIVLSVLGVAGVGVGAGLIARGSEGDDQMIQSKDFRGPGIGVMVGGSALLVGGVAMIVADRVKAKREARRSPTAFRW